MQMASYVLWDPEIHRCTAL